MHIESTYNYLNSQGVYLLSRLCGWCIEHKLILVVGWLVYMFLLNCRWEQQRYIQSVGFSQMASVNSDCRGSVDSDCSVQSCQPIGQCGFRLQCLPVSQMVQCGFRLGQCGFRLQCLSVSQMVQCGFILVSLLHKQQQGIKGLVCAFNLFVCLIWDTFIVHMDINTQQN